MELLGSFLGWFFLGMVAVVGLCAIMIPACLIYDSKFLSFKRMLKFARKWHRYEITKTSNMFGVYSWEKNFVSSYTPTRKRLPGLCIVLVKLHTNGLSIWYRILQQVTELIFIKEKNYD